MIFDPVIKSRIAIFRLRSSIAIQPHRACLRILSESPCSTNLSFGRNDYILVGINLEFGSGKVYLKHWSLGYCSSTLWVCIIFCISIHYIRTLASPKRCLSFWTRLCTVNHLFHERFTKRQWQEILRKWQRNVYFLSAHFLINKLAFCLSIRLLVWRRYLSKSLYGRYM